MISGHGTKKLLSMGFEILGLALDVDVMFYFASSSSPLIGVQQEKELQKLTAVHLSYGTLPLP